MIRHRRRRPRVAWLVWPAVLAAPLRGGAVAGEPDAAAVSPGGPWAAIARDPAFTFAVIGDTRPNVRFDPPRTADFVAQIGEINQLDPDFAIDLGDLIVGHTNDLGRVEAMWDQFDRIAGLFTVPLVLVVGNHDVWSPPTLDIYRRRYGPTHFAFDHRGVHFVVLDSEAMDERGQVLDRIEGSQLEWLSADLASRSGAGLTFVFLHKPLWQELNVRPTASEAWWRQVHPLLARHGVAAVFAAHWHEYTRFPARDGVAYYVTGGGGAEIDADESIGGFLHHMLITVRGRAWRAAVVKAGAVHADALVTAESRPYVKGLGALGAVRLEATEGAQTLEIPLQNAFGEPALLTVSLATGAGSGWQFTPDRHTVLLRAREAKALRFAVACEAMKAYPPPRCTVKSESMGQVLGTYAVVLPVAPFRRAIAGRVAEAPRIDGDLADPCWVQASALEPLVTLGDGLPPAAGTHVQLAHDGRMLYVAAVCDEPDMASLRAESSARDGEILQDDSLQLFLDPGGDGATYVHMAVNAGAVQYDARHAPSLDPAQSVRWDAPWQAAVSRGGGRWTVELAIELAALSQSAPVPGGPWRFNVARSRRAAGPEASSWSLCRQSIAEPASFGTLSFD